MRKAVVVDANDVKKILAEHFGVQEADIIKSQYSYTVMLDEEEKTDYSNSACAAHD